MPKPTEFHEAFARALAGIAPRVVTLDETGSTNDEARALARAGAPDGSVVIAKAQTAGRGRLGREWVAHAGASLTASWIVRPHLPPASWTLLPLLAGLAVAEAVRTRTHVEATLKWPNDVLAGGRKLGGILVEAEPPDFAVVGLGVNVSQTAFDGDLAEIATSVAREGGIRLDRADLLAHTLTRFARALEEPAEALDRYRAVCATLGRAVLIRRREAPAIEGTATGIAASGALTVETAEGRVEIAAGDVEHVR